MCMSKIDRKESSFFLRFRKDMGGAASVELALVFPILIWAYLGMMVFYDGYRARMEAQSAALHVADLISRQSNTMTADYLEGMNDVYDFLTTRPRDTRLRISSIMWDPDTLRPVIVWSYGTRGLPPLPQMANLDDLVNQDPPEPQEGESPSGFEDARNQLPIPELAQRIPDVLPGEALILVEAFTIWNSPIRMGLDFSRLTNVRLSPIAVTRPRFSPFIRYEGDNDYFPPELETYPESGDPTPPIPPEEPPVDNGNVVTIVETDFTDGNTQNWSSNQITTNSNITFFGPFGRETRTNPVTYQVNLGETSRYVEIEFDLFIIDSWDAYTRPWSPLSGDVFLITVNGTAISATPFLANPWGMFARDRSHVVSRAEGVFTTTMTLVESHRDIWGSGWNDQVWRVRIEVDNPVTNFTLGFIGDLSGDIHNESFGFRNFRVTAERGTHSQPQHFRPTSVKVFDDPATRFAVHAGCPDHRIGTKTFSLRPDDIMWNQHRFQIQARGDQFLRYCGVDISNTWSNNPFRSHATPNLIVNWDNQGYNWQGSYLRIRTDDGNNGWNCDTTLLIRTPTGQWIFNDDFWGWNSGRELGPALNGEYHIWVGRYGGGNCSTDIVFETY